MTENSLIRLYREMGARTPADLLDAETLVAAASGRLSGDRRDEVAARLSRSPLQTDLVRMLRELAPAAESLATVVSGRESLAHRRDSRSNTRDSQRAASARRMRWSAIAASLTLAFGAMLWKTSIDHPGAGVEAGSARSAGLPDRIFTSKDRIFAMVDEDASSHTSDGVFQSDFNGG